jgi:hypothetical protein
MVSKSIIEKIQKLLALGGDNPNENEATSATRMAMELLAKYNLSMTEVQDVDTEEISHEDYKPFGKSFPTWKSMLFDAICETNFCKLVIRPGTGNYIIIGKDTNRATSKMMFIYFCNVVDFETKEYLKSNYFNRSEGKTFGNSFRLGMCKRLVTRLLEKKQEIIRENTEKGIVRVDPYALAKNQNKDYMYKNFQIGASKSTNHNPNSYAFSAGYSVGGKVSLHGSKALTA